MGCKIPICFSVNYFFYLNSALKLMISSEKMTQWVNAVRVQIITAIYSVMWGAKQCVTGMKDGPGSFHSEHSRARVQHTVKCTNKYQRLKGGKWLVRFLDLCTTSTYVRYFWMQVNLEWLWVTCHYVTAHNEMWPLRFIIILTYSVKTDFAQEQVCVEHCHTSIYPKDDFVYIRVFFFFCFIMS